MAACFQRKSGLILCLVLGSFCSFAQIKWQNVDSLFQPLPPTVHVYYTNDTLNGMANIAYYLEAKLQTKSLEFTTAIGNGKRYTPSQFYVAEGKPLAIVNCTFFEFVRNRNLNVVVRNKQLIAYNTHTLAGRGKDTFTYRHPFPSAIGISKNGHGDIAWTYTDSVNRRIYAAQKIIRFTKDSISDFTLGQAKKIARETDQKLRKWKMVTAVGGGPVLVQENTIAVSNNEELKFAGKAIDDKHPRTAMGYTTDGKLIILCVQGRFKGIAEGASLTQIASILQQLGCREALNLDGGGSSCLLVNGKETIKPSDKEGQRPVPAVFIIKQQ